MPKQRYINRPDVIAMLGVTARTITEWQSNEYDPLPIAVEGSRGKPHQYDIAAVYQWAIRRRLAEIVPDDDGGIYDYEMERARLTHEQADKVGLEVEQLRGDLMARDIVLATWREMVMNMRAKLLSMPTKLTQLLLAAETGPEIQVVIRDGVHEALDEIANDGLPADVRRRIADSATGDDGGKTTATTDGK